MADLCEDFTSLWIERPTCIEHRSLHSTSSAPHGSSSLRSPGTNITISHLYTKKLPDIGELTFHKTQQEDSNLLPRALEDNILHEAGLLRGSTNDLSIFRVSSLLDQILQLVPYQQILTVGNVGAGRESSCVPLLLFVIRVPTAGTLTNDTSFRFRYDREVIETT
jgi:hypothetical protein